MYEKILIVDDEIHIREGLREALIKEDYNIDIAQNGIEALEKLRSSKYDVMITDVRMPGMTGLDLLEQSKIYSPDTEIIIMTAYGTIEDAVCAIKSNAYDYISKPIDIKKIRLLIRDTLEHKKIIFSHKDTSYDFKKTKSAPKIISSHPRMQEILSIIKNIALSDATVLIQGESGTGKELIAHSIHYHSNRKENPFIIVNCGAIPENLLESELFGHEKGSFTGAISRQIGKFELANQGTLFLDEISTMSLKSQVNLLRIIEEQTFRRVGGNENIKIEVRFIAASNTKLDELILEGKFREDLYYRLNVVPINLPPLRERQSDIPLLIEDFLKYFCDKYKRELKKISEDALKYMVEYYWHGNIRELKNIIERLVVIIPDNIIEPSHLPANILIRGHIPYTNNNEYQELTVEKMEIELIRRTLDKFSGHREKTSKALGISLRTLQYKIKRYAIK
ncbi:MAG: sigma-54-dependent Fis family transcriptional regulator [Candidatus Firestonebacteria bacterium]|nr:sigma-54-dependent Fis family transcriptional regulator [Candidatus Firestonebacteria bacterium]